MPTRNPHRLRLPLLIAAALLHGLGASAQAPGPDAGADAATTANNEREVLARAGMQSAAATLAPLGNASRVQGTVQFFAGPERMVVHVQLSGGEPGLRGFHVHESGECSAAEHPERSSHFNPGERPHGGPTDASDRRHAGDLGNVLFNDDGTADQWLQNRELTVDGDLGIVGRTVVLHASEDDLESQPGGESGSAVACGVIQMTATPG